MKAGVRSEERGVRSDIGIFLLTLILLSQACTPDREIKVWGDPGFSESKGIMAFKGVPYSGTIAGFGEDGDTSLLMTYENGKEEGEFLSWYPGHKLRERRYFTGGHKTGFHEGWWENGKKKFEYHFSDDVYDGNVKEWSNKGILYRDFNYRKGQEDGLQRMWFDNGKLRANYEVVNGRRYGLQGTKNCVNTNANDLKKQ